MKNDLLKIINHYGIVHQQRKLNEEVFELQEAIIKHENKGPVVTAIESLNKIACSVSNQKYEMLSIKNIEEEFADVMVLLSQIKYYYELDSEKIEKIMKEKIARQLERMKNE